MPASSSTRLALAHAKASARLPKSVMSAQTPTPMIHAVRKQPARNARRAPTPGAITFTPNAHQPSTARMRKITTPRAMPTIHDPSVRWRTPIGARNWCLIDFDHTSKSTAYATSSWHTCTTESAIVPSSTKAVASLRSSRKRVMRPMDTTPTIGQKSSSKKKKTFRVAISRLRTAKAQIATASARQLNEDLLQLGLLHLHALDLTPLGVQLAQQLGQPLLGVVHRASDPAVVVGAPEHAWRVTQPRRRWLHPKGDYVAEADLTLEVVVLGARRGGELDRLDELVDPPRQRGAVEPVETAVERHDLADT